MDEVHTNAVHFIDVMLIPCSLLTPLNTPCHFSFEFFPTLPPFFL